MGIDSFNYVTTDGVKKSGIAKVLLTIKSGKFSSDPYFGNALNYTFHNTYKYDVVADNNNKSLAIGNNTEPRWSGAVHGYCIINDRNYNNFNLRFKAKNSEIKKEAEVAIIMFLTAPTYRFKRLVKF